HTSSKRDWSSDVCSSDLEVDRFRAAYGGNAEDRPRQAVLFGTTNESSGFLLDTTGNRRFWPIHVGATNADRVFALTDSDIDQVRSEERRVGKECRAWSEK